MKSSVKSAVQVSVAPYADLVVSVAPYADLVLADLLQITCFACTLLHPLLLMQVGAPSGATRVL